MAKITSRQWEQGHRKFMDALSAELPKRGFRKGFLKLRSDGPFARRLSKKWITKFMEAKGITDFGAIDWNALIKYIFENLPAIIEAIMKLFV